MKSVIGLWFCQKERRKLKKSSIFSFLLLSFLSVSSRVPDNRLSHIGRQFSETEEAKAAVSSPPPPPSATPQQTVVRRSLVSGLLFLTNLVLEAINWKDPRFLFFFFCLLHRYLYSNNITTIDDHRVWKTKAAPRSVSTVDIKTLFMEIVTTRRQNARLTDDIDCSSV